RKLRCNGKLRVLRFLNELAESGLKDLVLKLCGVCKMASNKSFRVRRVFGKLVRLNVVFQEIRVHDRNRICQEQNARLVLPTVNSRIEVVERLRLIRQVVQRTLLNDELIKNDRCHGRVGNRLLRLRVRKLHEISARFPLTLLRVLVELCHLGLVRSEEHTSELQSRENLV